MPSISFMSLYPPETADGAAYTGSGTATTVSPAPDYQFQGGTSDLQVGSVVRVKARFQFTTGGTPGNLTLAWTFGGPTATTLCSTGAIALPASVTNQTGEFEAEFVVRSWGATGTVMAIGKAVNISSTAGIVSMAPATAPVTATIDTTTAKTTQLAATFSAAGNSLTVHNWFVERLNQ